MLRRGETKVEQKPRVAEELADSESDNDEPELKLRRPLANGNGSAVQGAHEYRAGAIMHISLTNFITYDRIDVRPGPHMNMIIGPNGTGKSSIVCAIALGLGENTSVMKRAKDISEFVKHGHEHGAIEITLATGGSGSVRIRREMARQGNKSSWKIDGRASTFAEVQRRTRELRIQVNNLCQFLPQDRVVEFSKMSAQGLLKQTQAAVGREDLQQLQEELVKRRAQERQAMGEAQRLRGDTETLRKQNALLERDVQRWQERQTAESQLRVLTALVPLARYAEIKAAHDDAKRAKNVAQAAYLQKRDSAEATELEQKMDELEARAADHERARRAAGDDRLGAEKAVRQQVTKLERLEAEQGELRDELRSAHTQAQRRREQIAALRAEVARLDAAVAQDEPAAAEEEDAGARRAAQGLRERQLQLTNELVAIGDEKRALSSSGRQIGGDIERRMAQLRGLDDEAQRRREALRRVHDDSVRALEWLESNRKMFAQHVFAPICLEASVRDARYAAAVEAVVGTGTLRTFVAQCDADYHVFTREVNDRLGLRVSVVSAAELKAPGALQPAHSRDTLAGLGFGGYAVDFVEAPRAVLAVLCSREKIHEIPLALGAVDHVACERLRLREYIADATRYTLTRGRYGSHASTVTTARIHAQSRLLGGGGESDEVRATRERLGSEIDKLRDTESSNEAQMKRLTTREGKIRDAHRQIESQEAELREKRRARADALEAWERQRVHATTKRAQLQSLTADNRRGSADEIAEIKRRVEKGLCNNARDRAKCLAAAAKHAATAVSALHSLARGGLAGFRDTRALAEHRAAMLRLREAVAEAQAELERATDAFNVAKSAARSALESTRAATSELTEEEREAVRAEQERRAAAHATSDELETELATCRQRLSMAAASGVSSAVIAMFAERQKRLAAMVAQAQQLDAELLRVRRRKRQARAQWEQPLSDVVARISEKFRAMFDHIDCLGEVSLRKAGDGVISSSSVEGEEGGVDDEDYDNWGIEIRVAFRRNEALQALDNHRQSGGERAVSTILYLQALQSLVAAPFRVVDEINQGMDERNERLVHSLIVDSACQQGSSQYFLITPKLLPDLDYHPLMKVLCIFNGEWQPESFNFGKYISNARRSA